MSHTLLDGVNEVLKRVAMIHGDAGELTSLTSQSRQRSIDIAVQAINEGNDELYSTAGVAQPSGQAESTITLVNATRSYSLASDLVRLRWPFIDKTNNQYLYQYPGGYNQAIFDDPEQDDTGLPNFAAINPTSGNLHVDRAPTTVEAGRIYTYQYDRDLVMDTATDTFPYTDAVFRAMVPVWAQLWRRDQQKDFDTALYTLSVGRAARLLSRQLPRDSYYPR